MRSKAMTLTMMVMVMVMVIAVGTASAGTIWQAADEGALLEREGERRIIPDRYRTVALDAAELDVVLSTAPFETAHPKGLSDVTLPLPLPYGGELQLRIVESPVMARALANAYPEIRTYRVFSASDTSIRGRADWTPHGFHAMVRTPEGTVFVDPYVPGDTRHYISYYRHDHTRTDSSFTCLVGDEADPQPGREWTAPKTGERSYGTELRTYRLAVAATGEYTQFHGGTVVDGLAAVVTAMNRVNEVYERDAAIHMELVANNDQIIYTNGATDPYTNDNGPAMLSQNQSNLDNVIGSANYDMGHVFSTGGGGIASLGCSCYSSYKARGVTGSPSPINDYFWIDYVAHEMGHQWDANHSFNGNESGCGGGNRNASTAYEPGSGSTIMAYAGLCGSQNLQYNSDDYFHGVSLDEITSFSQFGYGNVCASVTSTGNTPPTVDAGPDYTIPYETPFELTGSASDVDGDDLTYCWEEFDLGPAGHPNSPVGNAPIFRSFDPMSSPMRSFPKATTLVNNQQIIGEILPSTDRTLHFRLTVRDNQVGTGGVADDTMTVNVITSAGPFQVTNPNSQITWQGPGPHLVEWDVAGTDSSPVSCSMVNILFSTNSGYTWSQTLASGVPNDGSHEVYLSTFDTDFARLRIECEDGIFFDISDSRFTVNGAVAAIFTDDFESGNTSSWSTVVP